MTDAAQVLKTKAKQKTEKKSKPKQKKEKVAVVAKKVAKKTKKPRAKVVFSKEGLAAFHDAALDKLAAKATVAVVKKTSSPVEKLMQATALLFVRYRKEKGLTSAQLAEKLKVHTTSISHLEKGDRSLIRLDKAAEYAKKLGIKPADLIADIFKLAAI